MQLKKKFNLKFKVIIFELKIKHIFFFLLKCRKKYTYVACEIKKSISSLLSANNYVKFCANNFETL